MQLKMNLGYLLIEFNLVSFKPHRQYKLTVTVLHGRTFHIMIQDVKGNSKSSPEVLWLNNKPATYIRSSC